MGLFDIYFVSFDSGKWLKKLPYLLRKQTPLHDGFPLPAAGPGLQLFTEGNSLPLALGVGGLEDARGRHEVLNVLTEDLVLRL